ncbi:large subunit ribosomal protein L17, partial [Phenoliferia sp. Uapishka_3]
MLMLRNMVSSLLQHEQITTTVAKAKEAQRLTEQVIGWGKKGGKSNWDRANAYLLVSPPPPLSSHTLQPECAYPATQPQADYGCIIEQNPTMTLRPLFTTYASRYASRSGGYTRLHRAGHRQGDHAPLAVLELVDGPNDLKFESAARTVGREMAVRAKEGAGVEGWWTFRKRVEGGREEDVVKRLMEAVELEEMTKKNVGKALAFRVGDFAATTPSSTVDESLLPPPTDSEAPEADESSPSPTLSPSTQFLNRAHHHYLLTIASFSLSTTPSPDPLRKVQQLSQRLNPSDERGPPNAVHTVPYSGRRAKAGERTDGWALDEESERTSKFGGPISRAKGSKGREGRKESWVPPVKEVKEAEL